jgi:hypothetical protein
MMERRRQEVGEAEKITQLTKQWSIVHTTKDWNFLKLI